MYVGLEKQECRGKVPCSSHPVSGPHSNLVYHWWCQQWQKHPSGFHPGKLLHSSCSPDRTLLSRVSCPDTTQEVRDEGPPPGGQSNHTNYLNSSAQQVYLLICIDSVWTSDYLANAYEYNAALHFVVQISSAIRNSFSWFLCPLDGIPIFSCFEHVLSFWNYTVFKIYCV